MDQTVRSAEARPPSSTTLASAAYERLRRDIRIGRLAPGEKLRIDALRAIYEIGASPLREALNRLSAEGLVVQEDQRGFRVPPVSIEDLLELTRTRCWLNEIALRESGIAIVRCPVGDKYVMEEMLTRHISLGGEQSGHVIFSDYLFTGDGLCTALNVLRTMAVTGRSLGDLADDLVNYPQILMNVRVRKKVDLQGVPRVADTISRVEARVAGHGRLLVRYSGTEPLLRVMLEGQDQDEIQAWAQEIVDVVKQEIG